MSRFAVWERGYAPFKRGGAQLPHSNIISIWVFFAQEAFS